MNGDHFWLELAGVIGLGLLIGAMVALPLSAFLIVAIFAAFVFLTTGEPRRLR